jgi:hypothetical protein
MFIFVLVFVAAVLAATTPQCRTFNDGATKKCAGHQKSLRTRMNTGFAGAKIFCDEDFWSNSGEFCDMQNNDCETFTGQRCQRPHAHVFHASNVFC